MVSLKLENHRNQLVIFWSYAGSWRFPKQSMAGCLEVHKLHQLESKKWYTRCIHSTHDFSKIVFREVEETYTPRIPAFTNLESIPRSLSIISPLESPSCVANDFLPTTEVVETAGKAIHKVPSRRRRQTAFFLREWYPHEHPFQLEDEASASQRIKKIAEDQQNKKKWLTVIAKQRVCQKAKVKNVMMLFWSQSDLDDFTRQSGSWSMISSPSAEIQNHLLL